MVFVMGFLALILEQLPLVSIITQTSPQYQQLFVVGEWPVLFHVQC